MPEPDQAAKDLLAAAKQESDAQPLPAEPVTQQVRSVMQHVMGVQFQAGPAPNALVDKLGPEHITAVITNAHAESESTQSSRRLYFCVGVATFLAACGMFLYADKIEPLEKIITALLGFVGGYGFGKVRQK